MPQSITGISFPFRIGNKGGVVLSSTTQYDVPHIVESIVQIIGTKPMERIMEYQIKCEASTYIFDPNDESTRSLIAYEVKKAIEECDTRIEIVSVEPYVLNNEDNVIYAHLTFRVKKYAGTYNTDVKVGEYR